MHSKTTSQYAHRIQKFSIELDCAPFMPRPSDLFPSVLEGTPLSPADFETGVPFFGNQMWVLKEVGKDDAFTQHKMLFKERIEALFNSGAIRYGSW